MVQLNFIFRSVWPPLEQGQTPWRLKKVEKYWNMLGEKVENNFLLQVGLQVEQGQAPGAAGIAKPPH